MKIPRWLVRIIKPVVQEAIREAREQAQAEVERRLADRLRREMTTGTDSSRTLQNAVDWADFTGRGLNLRSPGLSFPCPPDPPT